MLDAPISWAQRTEWMDRFNGIVTADNRPIQSMRYSVKKRFVGGWRRNGSSFGLDQLIRGGHVSIMRVPPKQAVHDCCALHGQGIVTN